jgi:uncharacterized membrane protein YvlD (DUF360 family)
MKEKVFNIILHILLFWVISDIFTGIKVKEGIAGYLIAGIIAGIVMIVVVPLIRFFTLPVKLISLILVSILVSLILFLIFNFGLPVVDFTNGTIAGFQNTYFTLPEIKFGMIENVIVGGTFFGILSALLIWLKGKD